MAIKEFTFLSNNKRDQVYAWEYTPLHEPKAVVQIVHGFGEHSRRYLHMIGKLQEVGYVVFADDHVGHGKTALRQNTWGDPGDNGYMTCIEDEHTLHEIAVKEYPDIPYILFGHSWGSMIAREYAALYGEELSAMILCGVVAQMKSPDMEEDLKKVEQLVTEGHGADDGTEWFAKVFPGMLERIENPEYPTAWVATDKGVVRDHALDPLNSMKPSVQLVLDFVRLYTIVMDQNWAQQVPAELPVYLIAGDQDPCCNYGEGLYHAANQLVEAGNKNVAVKCYDGYRHEIHNEPKLRDEVVNGILCFIDRVLVSR